MQAPFCPAEGLLTVAAAASSTPSASRCEDSSITLRVPIEDAHIPNLYVQVDLVGAAPRVDDEGEPVDGAARPAGLCHRQLDLSVPPLSRTLALEIAPEETELEPGGRRPSI